MFSTTKLVSAITALCIVTAKSLTARDVCSAVKVSTTDLEKASCIPMSEDCPCTDILPIGITHLLTYSELTLAYPEFASPEVDAKLPATFNQTAWVELGLDATTWDQCRLGAPVESGKPTDCPAVFCQYYEDIDVKTQAIILSLGFTAASWNDFDTAFNMCMSNLGTLFESVHRHDQ